MLGIVLSFPSIAVLLLFQMVIVSRLQLLNGSADIVLIGVAAWALHDRSVGAWAWGLVAGITIGFISAAPAVIPIFSYAGVIFLSTQLKKRVWQMPILAMFIVVIFGTIFQQFVLFLTMQFSNNPIPFGSAFELVIMPSLFLNLILAIPLYIIFRDLINFLYPLDQD